MNYQELIDEKNGYASDDARIAFILRYHKNRLAALQIKKQEVEREIEHLEHYFTITKDRNEFFYALNTFWPNYLFRLKKIGPYLFTAICFLFFFATPLLILVGLVTLFVISSFCNFCMWTSR